eukprot:g8609.t1
MECGINPTCTPCPSHAPYTATNINIFTSIDVCSVEKDDTYCDAGFGMYTEKKTIRSSGHCINKIITEAECELAAEYNRKNNIDKNVGYKGRWSYGPPGCSYYKSISYSNIYYWNDDTESTRECSNRYKCVCSHKPSCAKCLPNTYKAAGVGACKECHKPDITNAARSECYNPKSEKLFNSHSKLIGQITKTLSASKNAENNVNSGQITKLQRMWATNEVRKTYDEMREKHATAYQKHGKHEETR